MYMHVHCTVCHGHMLCICLSVTMTTVHHSLSPEQLPQYVMQKDVSLWDTNMTVLIEIFSQSVNRITALTGGHSCACTHVTRFMISGKRIKNETEEYEWNVRPRNGNGMRPRNGNGM